MGRFEDRIFPALGKFTCPRKLTVSHRVQGFWIHKSLAFPLAPRPPLVGSKGNPTYPQIS